VGAAARGSGTGALPAATRRRPSADGWRQRAGIIDLGRARGRRGGIRLGAKGRRGRGGRRRRGVRIELRIGDRLRADPRVELRIGDRSRLGAAPRGELRIGDRGRLRADPRGERGRQRRLGQPRRLVAVGQLARDQEMQVVADLDRLGEARRCLDVGALRTRA
jgi:hypothetical protein